MGSCSIREGRFCSLHKLYIEMGGECGWVWRSAWTNFCTIYAKVMKRWLLHVLYLHHPKWRERAPHLPQKCHTCPVTAHSTCGRKVMESLFQVELYRLLCSCFLHPHRAAGCTLSRAALNHRRFSGLSCTVSSFRADHVHLDKDELDYY